MEGSPGSALEGANPHTLTDLLPHSCQNSTCALLPENNNNNNNSRQNGKQYKHVCKVHTLPTYHLTCTFPSPYWQREREGLERYVPVIRRHMDGCKGPRSPRSRKRTFGEGKDVAATDWLHVCGGSTWQRTVGRCPRRRSAWWCWPKEGPFSHMAQLHLAVN